MSTRDGLGIAWYTDVQNDYIKDVSGARPALYKSQSPPTNDFNLRSLCNNTETKCVLAHIRATSGSVVTPVNNHPFVFGRHAFMHNGVVSDFSRIRRNLTDLLAYDAYCNVLGSTDSEHVAALYMTHLTQNGDKSTWDKEYPVTAMRDAMIASIVDILKLQDAELGSRKLPNSLNFCATDGRRMVACRFRNHGTEQPPSLYWSEFAGRTLNRKYPGDPNENKINKEATKAADGKFSLPTVS